jgi:hypothetical protein
VALQLQDKPIVQQQGLGFGGRTYHHGHRQTAFAWNNTRYTRRSPESTLLYKVVQENLRSFEDLCREEGKHLPGHVTKEFEAFLKCGVLAHGFLRFRCVDCKHERLVAFSCKKRGFCGSCGARRMAETAAHLTDNVFPTSTIIRQWVLSMPIPLRYMCARNSKLQGKILRYVNSVIAKSIKKSVQHRLDEKYPNNKIRNLEAGAVTLIQRFGGHVNLNVHFHMLHVQGAWEISNDESSVTFHSANNPTNEELLSCVEKIASGVLRILKRMNLVEQDDSGVDVIMENNNSDGDDPLAGIQAASTQNKIALGIRKGQNVRRLIEQLEEEYLQSEPKLTGDMAVSFMGFSLHAAVSAWSTNRARLEQLVRYTARPAVSEERLSQANNGDIHYRLKTPWTDGTTGVVFSPLEFLEKLSALVPPPRIHLTRFHGILAPHSKFRKLVVPQIDEKVEGNTDVEKSLEVQDEDSELKQKRISWAKLLSRVFALDMANCDHCGGELKAISAVIKQDVVMKILTHLGLPARAPPISPSRVPRQEEFWDQSNHFDEFSQLN